MVLLSMFVGAVCMSMSTAVQTIHAEQLTDQKVRGARGTHAVEALLITHSRHGHPPPPLGPRPVMGTTPPGCADPTSTST
jgi:hypothetical protein